MAEKKRRKCHFTEKLKVEFPHIKSANNDNNGTLVKCVVCNISFNISIGGRASITKHNESAKHKKLLEAASSSQSVSLFFTKQGFCEDEKKTALAEGIFAFHTLIHNHSFRSMDCTSKLLQNLYDKKFRCARTKCEAIIRSTFLNFVQEDLKKDLEEAKYVCLLGDASNHKATKLYPVLVRYFNFKSGVNVKI